MALAGSIAGYASAVRVDARLGVFSNPGSVTAAPAGIVLDERGRSHAFEWNEVRSVAVRRGRIELVTVAERERTARTKDGPATRRYVDQRVHRFVPAVDGVREPALVETFARVLDDMRQGTFRFNGTSWLEHQNRVEHLRTEFAAQDEPVIVTAAVGLWVAIGVVLALVIPLALNLAEVRAMPAGVFVLRDRIGAFDPRTLVAAFALSALATMAVLRFALGTQAVVWVRGIARGWKRGGHLRRTGLLLFGRSLLGTSSAAVFALLALLTFWPNVAATVYLDEGGVRNAVLLPFVSIDERWTGATAVPSGTGVLVRFPDGRMLSTVGRELGGGSVAQLLVYAERWSAPR